MSTRTAHDVLLLGAARECAGIERVQVELPPDATVADVRISLATTLPALAGLLPACAIAIKHRYRREEDLVGDSPGEIVLVPPVSGG